MNTSQETHGFPGPLFLIGVSRSGTKLLRDLLNNHSRVGIAMIESKFIPSLYPKYSRWDQEKLKKEFDIFYRDFQGTFFAMSMEEEGNPIDRDAWYRSVAKWTYAGVLEALFKQLAAAGGKTIWGDKTPLHLLYIPMLKKMFPTAKFIHIIRDIRDVCLSARKAWNRNIYYSAQRWSQSLDRARKDAALHAPDDYMEIKYETLIHEPGETLKQACRFLGIPYETHMAILKKPSEDEGDARGKAFIMQGNTGKWKTRLTPRQLARLESLCAPLLTDLGYPLSQPFTGRTKRMNPIRMYYYYFQELLYIFRMQMKRKSVGAAAKTIFRKIKFRISRRFKH